MVNVLALGNAIVDLQQQISDSDFDKLGLTKSSMNLVNEAQQSELLKTLGKSEINKASGGSAANSIICLAQLGSKAGFCCTVGDDEYGTFYTQELTELKINTNAKIESDLPTGTSLILITPDAERTMNTCLGASATFGIENIDESSISDADWIYIEGYLLSGDDSFAAVEKACQIASSKNTKIAFTLSDVFIADIFKERANTILDKSDLVFANIEEAKTLVGSTDDAEAMECLANRCEKVAITHGSKGSFIFENGKKSAVEAVPTSAIDSTGAGDAYAGGVLHGIVSNSSFLSAATLGSNIASKVVGQMGPRLTQEEVESIKNNCCI